MRDEVVKLLQSLIKIDSSNPPGNERKIIYFIRDYLKKIGVSSKIYEFKKDRLNLVCSLKSNHSFKKILFTPHVDTVPAGGKWRFSPLSGKIHKGRVYGRGATDCKANVAVSLALIKQIKDKNIKLNNLDLCFAFAADEEAGSFYGTIPLVKKLKNIDYGVVLDADEFDIIVAQKGLLHLRVELFGKEAHGAYPERGVSAVEKAVEIIHSLKTTFTHPVCDVVHPILKKPTLNVGTFKGGARVNIVAGYASFDLDFRYIPGQKKDQIISQVEKIINKQKIAYKLTVLAWQDPIQINQNLAPLKVLKKVLKEHKITPKLKPSFGATVLNFLEERNIKSFSFGIGTSGTCHTANEYVKINNLIKADKILLGYVLSLDRSIGQKRS